MRAPIGHLRARGYRLLTVIGLTAAIGGCGEFESVELPNRPNLDSFEFVQDTLRVTGCSDEKCHGVLQGDFRISIEPPEGIAFIEEYQLAKRFVDLKAPSESRLLTVALAGTEDSFQHPVCFEDKTSCAYRVVAAWIAALGPQDTQPDEIDCMPTPRSCQSESEQ